MKPTRISLKMLALCGAAAAAAVMGTVTVATGSPGVGGSAAVVATAGTVTSPIPASTPSVPNAAPVVKPTPFVGGDWPGMGSFGEDWAR